MDLFDQHSARYARHRSQGIIVPGNLLDDDHHPGVKEVERSSFLAALGHSRVRCGKTARRTVRETDRRFSITLSKDDGFTPISKAGADRGTVKLRGPVLRQVNPKAGARPAAAAVEPHEAVAQCLGG